MDSTLDVILAILQEADIGNYYLTGDAGSHYLVELPSDKRPIKIMCNFNGVIWSDILPTTSLIVHVCDGVGCCRGRLTTLPVHGETFYGILEDLEFYTFLINIIDKWKIDKLQ